MKEATTSTEPTETTETTGDIENPDSSQTISQSITKLMSRWCQGHWTPMWVLGTAYLLLFIAYMGFREFGNKSAGFILHTIVALSFVIGCAWNLFHTPSHGEFYRIAHQWMGWIAMGGGFFVVVSGYVLVLTGKHSLSDTAATTFMVTGGFQLAVQVLLIYCVKFALPAIDNNKSINAADNDKDKKEKKRKLVIYYHMMSANILFYCCGLLPAINRMPEIFGFADSDTWTFASMPIGLVFCFISIYYYARQIYEEQPV